MNPLNEIFACTDGSVYSISVYDHAKWAANRIGLPIRVIHGVEPERQPAYGMDIAGNVGLGTNEVLLREMIEFEEERIRWAEERAVKILDHAQKYFAQEGMGSVTVERGHGALVDIIKSYEQNVELVVIGKRGESADFAKLHLGSNLERVVRAVPHPVLVASRSFNPITSFLLAFDNSPSSHKAVDYIVNSQLLKGLECTFFASTRNEEGLKEAAESHAQRLIDAGFTVKMHFTDEKVQQALPEYVQQAAVPLVVMGAYGHSRIREFIIGSTTSKMIRNCLVPLLLFH